MIDVSHQVSSIERQVGSRALAAGGRSAEAPWFNLDPLPPVAELAAHHGDPHSQALHFTALSVRSLWLHRAQQAH